MNPYLNLSGRGVLVGMIDSGIDYLNQEFMREDDTSRIVKIWDKTIQADEVSEFKFGAIYSNEKINEAINVYRGGGDPYSIVPSKDELDHGTKMAGIIGARGYNGKMQGIANDCDFVVVKLLQSQNYKKVLRENNLTPFPVYDNSEVLAAIELRISKNMKRLEFYIWIRKPDKMSLNVIAPSGEEMGFFESKIYSIENKDFYLTNTHLEVTCYNPENFNGHQVFFFKFY